MSDTDTYNQLVEIMLDGSEYHTDELYDDV